MRGHPIHRPEGEGHFQLPHGGLGPSGVLGQPSERLVGDGIERVDLDQPLVGRLQAGVVSCVVRQRREPADGVDRCLVVHQQTLQLLNLTLGIAFLLGEACQLPPRAAQAGRHRRQFGRTLERRARGRGIAGGAQRLAQPELHVEVVRLFLRQLAQRLDALRPLRQVPRGVLQGAPQRAELRLHKRVEARLQTLVVEIDAGEGLLGLQPVAVRANQRAEGFHAVGLDHVLDHHRGIEIGERYRLGPREPAFELADRQQRAGVERPRELQHLVAAPGEVLAFLLVGRDPLAQPARQPLIRHLQRDDMGYLVPQRRHPVEVARRAGARRVERDHLAEARAQGADHAGQTQRAHREVVVVRKYLDEDWGLQRHLVLRRELVERLLRDVHNVWFESRGLVGMQPHDEISALDGHEFVEVVHHLQQVERHHVVGVFLERPLQRDARGRLVAGAQQVHPELAVGAGIVGIELQRTLHEGHRLGKAVGPRRLAPRDAVDVTVVRVDRQHALDLGGEIVRAVLQVGDGRQQRTRLQAARVDLEGPFDRLAGGVAVPVAELQLRDEKVRRDVRLVHAEGALHRPAGHRRVLVRQYPCHADQRRHPVLVELQRILKRLQGVRVVVFLEEQLAPGSVDRGIVGQHARGAAQERVGPPEASRGTRGEGAVVLRQPVEGIQSADDDRLEERHGLAGASDGHEQAGELQTGHAARRLPGNGREQRLGLLVIPNLDQ